MERQLPNWLDAYLEYTEDLEAPEKYHFWTAYVLLATVLKRQVFLQLRFKVYPNLFVVLVGMSAKTRKSAALDVGIDLLHKARTSSHIITGTMTPEGLVKHLNRASVVANPNDSEHPLTKTDSHILIHADELATLFGYERTRAAKLAILLTETYNARDLYEHTTVKDTTIPLHNLYPNLLAATDPRNLKVLPEEAVAGLVGRTVFVTANKRRKSIPLPEETKGLNDLQIKLIHDLEVISQLRGMVDFTQAGRRLYEAWYNQLSEHETDDTRQEAFFERCHTLVLKLAILTSIAKSNSLIVDDIDIALGIQLVENQLNELGTLSDWLATGSYAQNRARFLQVLRRNGGMASRKIMMRATTLDILTIEMIEQGLENEGTISVKVAGRDMIYKLLVSPD